MRSLIRNALEAKAKSESSKDDSFQTTFSRPPSGFDEPDEDMRELLELATAGLNPKQQLGSSTQREKIEEQVPMLQRSKFLDLIEEGRVLVRSAIPHKPTHVLTAIPFEASIIDRLRHLHISKPKVFLSSIYIRNCLLITLISLTRLSKLTFGKQFSRATTSPTLLELEAEKHLVIFFILNKLC